MKEFTISGYFSEKQCKALAEKLNGKTFYNWEVGYSNQCGNCSLIVSSEYKASIKELKESFIWLALSELANA